MTAELEARTMTQEFQITAPEALDPLRPIEWDSAPLPPHLGWGSDVTEADRHAVDAAQRKVLLVNRLSILDAIARRLVERGWPAGAALMAAVTLNTETNSCDSDIREVGAEIAKLRLAVCDLGDHLGAASKMAGW